jgi:SAM-dependent methyltransferase
MRIEKERFYPAAFMPPWVRHQHLERYRWAAQFVAGKRVLDVACGTGYGTAILADAGAAQVDGFDCSREAIDFAKEAWPLPNVRFDVAVTDRLPVVNSSYDFYISFETIEHVDDDDALLAEARRVLRPGGSLLVSTPNRELLDPGISINDRPFNRFHTREYCRDELDERLRRHFGNITWYGQRTFSSAYTSWLKRVGKRWPALAVKLHQIRKCLGWPWERPQLHLPTLCAGESPDSEVLIAACLSEASS